MSLTIDLPQLNDFEPLNLQALMSRAELMNRSDRKFFFPKEQLGEILAACAQDYSILEINNQRCFEYETEYYDTPNLFFYHEHHRGKSNRYKVRRRSYGSTGEEFIEVKHKVNKGNTIKLRVVANQLEQAKPLIEQEIGEWLTQQLTSQLLIKYWRITLLHKEKPEKVTLDMQLTCELTQREDAEASQMQVKDFQGLVIAEVKATRLQQNTFQSIMKLRKHRETSLSKYCLGCLALYPEIKQNRFKQTYKHILSIEHAS